MKINIYDLIQVSRISRDYFSYNPDGEVFYIIEKTEDGIYYIKEVGLFNAEDKEFGNDILSIHMNDEWFDVYRSRRGLIKTLDEAKKKLIKILEDKNEI